VRAAAADPARAALLNVPMAAHVADFETERAGFMRSIGSSARWNGTVHGLNSELSRWTVAQNTADKVVVRLYEWTTVNWTPAPREIPAEDLAARQLEPEKFAGSRREGDPVESGIGTWHEVTATRVGTGWEISTDRYAETDLFGVSPSGEAPPSDPFSAVTFSSLASRPTTRRPRRYRPRVSLFSNQVYDFQAAVAYSYQYVYNYNSNYVDENAPCSGGDCANFVSQSFYWGNEYPGNNWYRTWGNTCGQGNRWYGTLNWVNNQSLRSWARNNGRGVSKTAYTQLGLGDIINYDWDGVGGTDHVTIMCDAVSYLVNSHNNDRKNNVWNMGGAAGYSFTRMYTNYTV
jgi:hypothetical protein